uniref:ZAD domain-containing protein n=1 Tax=Glossina austeni TaxID=7395 RepID=A0A1A9VVF9_GLOAU
MIIAHKVEKMERFAIKIDKKLKANLYKICRLCGMDHPDMVQILTENKNEEEKDPIMVDAEPQLSQKIQELIGLTISKDDRMPQTMCTLCVEKINDFYEFRDMCYATNAQTRKLLGLKHQEVKKQLPVLDIKTELSIKEEMSSSSVLINKANNRKRKSDDVTVKKEASANAAVSNKKLRLASQTLKETALKKVNKQKLSNIDNKTAEFKEEIKEEIKEEPGASVNLITTMPGGTATVVTPSSKLKQICTICPERFASKAKLEAHFRTCHIPRVERYVCTACDEILNKNFDIKNHQLWHRHSKTPYKCGLCDERVLSFYAYAKHLRDHSFETPPALLVLDRECPQCQNSYATNFLYNIHPCAVHTKRCAGCNRLQRSESEYLKHSAQCAKVYLNYSKHILPAVAAMEDSVRIKNENEVEAAAEEYVRYSGAAVNMNPVVSLTRLGSPLLRSSNSAVIPGSNQQEETAKKSSKSRVSKKDFKRVDELLKSTFDTLVSIKHEPEMHMDTDLSVSVTDSGLESNERESNEQEDTDENNHSDGDYADHNDDSNDQEMSSAEIGEAAKIKQEVHDLSYGNSDASNVEYSNKMPVLKLKIKKEHGQLNSSLVDQTTEKRAEKRKKKKKHKEKEKTISDYENVKAVSGEEVQEANLCIKTEPIDMETDVNTVDLNPQPEATIMTSIPMMQLKIARISEGVEFNSSSAKDDQIEETLNRDLMPFEEDIKPNREELDNLLKITLVTGGVEMQSTAPVENSSLQSTLEEDSVSENYEHLDEQQNDILGKEIKQKAPLKWTKGRNKACKSTAGRMCKVSNTETAELQISSIHGGVSMLEHSATPEMMPVFIKAEPQRGYSDELTELTADELDNSVEGNENIAKISSIHGYVGEEIDFANIKIKQEKDLDIHDVQMSSMQTINGLKAKKFFVNNSNQGLENQEEYDECNYGDDDDDEDDIDEEEDEDSDEEDDEIEEEEEEREYREMELPPALDANHAEDETSDVNLKADFQSPTEVIGNPQIPFIISNVCTAPVTTNQQPQQECTDIPKHSENDLPVTDINAMVTETGTNPTPVKYDPDGNRGKIDLTQIMLAPQTSQPRDLTISSIAAGCSVNFSPTLAISNQEADETPPVPNVLEVPTASKKAFQTHYGNRGDDESVNLTLTRVREGIVQEPKDVQLDAQPFGDTVSIGNANLDQNIEEQQNQHNQQILEQHQQRHPRLTALVMHPYLEDISSSTSSILSDSLLETPRCSTAPLHIHQNVEETENILNESNRHLSRNFNFDNINEIAENNNNANIERELQDGEQARQALEQQAQDPQQASEEQQVAEQQQVSEQSQASEQQQTEEQRQTQEQQQIQEQQQTEEQQQAQEQQQSQDQQQQVQVQGPVQEQRTDDDVT